VVSVLVVVIYILGQGYERLLEGEAERLEVRAGKWSSGRAPSGGLGLLPHGC
jgi:Tfp pilus assembly protein PilO